MNYTSVPGFLYTYVNTSKKALVMKFTSAIIWTVILTIVCKSNASSKNQVESVQQHEADGQKLIKLGSAIDAYFLKLIGYAFKNLEKRVKECKDL